MVADSVSSGTRTAVTESSKYTESTNNNAPEDRWSNNITYQHLVISTSISLIQLWWIPYINDLTRLLPFLLAYNMLSVIISLPFLYLDVALGMVTKKSVLNCWDLAPMVRGIGISSLMICGCTAFVTSAVSAYCLAMFVHSFHSFLPWLHCAAVTPYPCGDRHGSLPPGVDTPAQSFFVNMVLNLDRSSGTLGLGSIVTELAIYFLITWVLVYMIAIKKIYSYSKLVLLKDGLTFFILITGLIAVLHLNGFTKMWNKADFTTLFNGFKMWRVALELSFISVASASGVLIMIGSYCPKDYMIVGNSIVISYFTSKITIMISAIILGAVNGALEVDFATNSTNIGAGASAAIVLWADYVARVPGSQFWSAIVFFTLFLLGITTTALHLQAMMSSFTGYAIRKISWALLILIVILYCFIGIFTLCSQSSIYIVNFLMHWAVSWPRILIIAMESIAITVMYGQTTFCEDIYFAAGVYPCMFVRVCWAVVPFMLVIMFAIQMGVLTYQRAALEWAVVTLTVLPIFIVVMFYMMFKCRVRNITSKT